jgi:HD-GYP domain-containing protein (c-di-GMP phosphodiesterase class II)
MSTVAGASPRAVLLDPDEQRVIEEQRARRLHSLAHREVWSFGLFAGGFLAVAILMAALLPSHRSPGIAAVLVLIAAYAASFRLDFEIGSGSAVPTQLMLVPMLFVLPAGFVPIAVAAGIVLGSLDEYLRGSLHLGRVVLRVVNAWHAVGPALVLGLAVERGPRLSDWPLYMAALLAQFVLDDVCAAGREWIALGVRPSVQLRAMVWVHSIDAGLAPVGLAVAFATESSPYGVVLALPLVGLLSVFARERRVRIDHELELRDAYRGTAFLLGDVVEADDSYTGIHSRDVVELTLRVADQLELSTRERRDAEFVALLHDVGKVRVPNSIINKPGPLTAEERTVMERHTIEGERLLHRVGGLLGEIGRVIRSCHEHWDGNGYPDGLAGDEIPLLARIVACCDAFNAMTSDRSYRKALPQHEAVAELRRGRGTQFDPRVVDALIETLAVA